MITARRVLYATAFLRALATGAVGVLLGLHLARCGLSPGAIGAVVSAGLAGTAAAALVATLGGDRFGRLRFLVVLSVLSVVGTLGLAGSNETLILGAFAFVGMANGMGKDRGAALVLEQAALAGAACDEERTGVIARYTMLQDVGHALGALVAGAPGLLAAGTGWTDVTASRATLASTALLACLALPLYLRAGAALDPTAPVARLRVSPASRRILFRVSALFAIDGLAGGFLTSTLLSYFFFVRFGVDEGVIGAMFFAARVLNAGSHLAAARLARAFGLVNTMVFTHIPSSLLLVAVAFAPSFGAAAVLFLLRECLVEMDVPTRQSYVLAVVAPEERTVASGVTNLVRLAAWAVAPAFAGALMVEGTMLAPLVIGAAMKISYDLMLWRAFRSVRAPEERGGR